jgi:hypothetical protein
MQSFADRRRTTHTTDLRWRLFAYHRHGTMHSRIGALIALWNDIPKHRWAATLARTAGVRGCHGMPCDGALHPDAGSVESACPQAGQPRHATQDTVDKFRIQRVASVAAAFLFAALATALVMAALWHAAKIAPLVFAFTFAIALYHGVFFGLPLFLVFRLKGWINVISCVVSGFAVGAVPAGVLTWPIQHPELRMSASVDGVPTIINGVITAAGWVNYVKPLIYFGSFGALGGFAFWVALISPASSAAAVVVRVIRELMDLPLKHGRASLHQQSAPRTQALSNRRERSSSSSRTTPVQGMSVAAQEAHVLASLLEARRGIGDPLNGLAEAFLAEIQLLLDTPWAVAMADLVYPQTRGERPPDFEKKLQYTHALLRLTAEDAEADKTLAEVRSLLKPASALREPELASRVMAIMAPA